jgi:hypothetical protein
MSCLSLLQSDGDAAPYQRIEYAKRPGAASGVVTRTKALPLFRLLGQLLRIYRSTALDASRLPGTSQRVPVTIGAITTTSIKLPPRPQRLLARRELLRSPRPPGGRTPLTLPQLVAFVAAARRVAAAVGMTGTRPPHDATAPLILGDLLPERRARSAARLARVCSSLQVQQDLSEMKCSVTAPCLRQRAINLLVGSRFTAPARQPEKVFSTGSRWPGP